MELALPPSAYKQRNALWLYAPTAMTSLSYGSSNLSALPTTAVAGSFPSGSGLELDDDDSDDDDELELEPLVLALAVVLPFPGNLTGAVAGVCR